jgi:23S rRNA pseudouridine1911/1915/1917 synthase
MKNSHSLEVIFEDQWIIVVNKPSGMLSVGFPGFHGKSAQDILSDMKKSKGKIRIAAVHRLDRDTSGVMMFACTAEAKERIMNDWQEIVSERVYRCVCERDADAALLPDSGTIDAPIAYNRADVGYVPKSSDKKALKDAESAVTHFKVIERGKDFDLVECELETGRKNQIRVHMAHIGHPVAGDEVYGSIAKRAAGMPHGKQAQTDRLALHARVLAFTHPFTHEHKRFETPEPTSFIKLVSVKKTPTASGKEAGSNSGKAGATGKAGAKEPAAEAIKIPRRQRGRQVKDGTVFGMEVKPSYADRSRSDRPAREKKENIEDLTDLKPVPKKSRTKQIRGSSRFIPGK